MSESFLIQDGIDIKSLLDAFEQFQLALKVAKTDLEKAGTIKLFEISFELSWKTMQRVLKARGKDVNSPKPIIREAALEKLIRNPETWLEFVDERNETVHTYNKKFANQIFSELGRFEAEALYFIQILKSHKA